MMERIEGEKGREEVRKRKQQEHIYKEKIWKRKKKGAKEGKK